MLEFCFEAIESNVDIDGGHGWALGHITIVGPNGSVSSNDETYRQAMMIYLSIVELLDGLRNFFIDASTSEYEFVGADSSFQIYFNKNDEGLIVIRFQEMEIGTAEMQQVSEAILRGVRMFLDAAASSLPASDPVYGDLHEAITAFEKLHAMLGWKDSG